jgi:hypothetical protein
VPNLGGFEVVGELTVDVLNQILKGAWDNGIIPHSTNVPPGTAFGPYAITDGVFNVPRDGVSLVMDTGINGVDVQLAGEAQAHIQNPPIPSAGFWDLSVNVTARVPIGIMPGTSIQVGALLDGIPRSSVSASLPGGDPIPPLAIGMVAEYVHQQYTSGVIQSSYSDPGVSFGGFTADAWLDVYDDPSKPNHHITVTDVGGGKVKVSIPVHLKLSNVHPGPAPSPMGVVANLTLTTPLQTTPGFVRAPIASQGTVAVEDYGPAPATDPEVGDFDSEGSNYSLAVSFFPALETVIKSQLQSRAQQIVNAIGDIQIVVPTQAQIESFIADQAWTAIKDNGNIALWTPSPPAGGGVTVTDVKPLALSDAVAFCLNNPAGDTSVIVNFIPAARTCAIAIDGAKVLQIVQDQLHRPESEGGFGPSFPPKTFHNVNGHDARLNSLDITLITGSIHMEGDVTVVNAIAGSIDVDASFSADAGLEWEDNPDGTQMIQPFTIGEPNVDLSLLAWILSFLLGFITLGLIGGIIALVVLAVATGVASQVGGAIIKDDVTGQIKGIGAWPQTLEGIGTVTAKFENPVGIDPTGITFGDAYQVVAIYASVTDALAHANGPYGIPEGSDVLLDGGAPKPHTSYAWELGDGATATGPQVTHRYADNGLYVAKLTTTVAEKGGVTTRHFAAVRVANVPATVDAGPAITIDEGAVTEFTATFTDPGWKDTHRAIFDFGDDSSPVEVPVTETHDEPLGRGSASASHAYCDNGDYTVTVRIIDKDGGIGVATKDVVVRNVAPTVAAPVEMFAYACTPITLVARFTDPGWCDTHTATWEFGDCSPAIPATVRERNDPPAGCGIAAATHRYESCGDFVALCTVVDDDGGIGRGVTVVRVVDVVNGGFEDGFHSHVLGVVGNGWAPYAQRAIGGLEQPSSGAAELAPEQYIVHGDGKRGQRSQRIAGTGTFRSGVYQRIGANVDWDYQVTGWYHLLAGGSDAVCRLGIDPAGGTDPAAASIVWIVGPQAAGWHPLSVRCTATARAVTVFFELDARGTGGQDTLGAARHVAYLDDVSLLPYPCPLGDAPPCEPPKPKPTCVDWKAEREARTLGQTFTKNGFTFESALRGDVLRVVLSGAPAGQGKLALPRRLLGVVLPFAADKVVASVWASTEKPIIMEALGAGDAVLGKVQSSGTPSPPQPETLKIEASGILGLVMTGGGGEGTLVELCIYGNGNTDRAPGTQPRPTGGRPTGDCGCGGKA